MADSSGGGEPASTTITYPPTPIPPDYNFARGFWNILGPSLLSGAMPTYPGSVDPGWSPTAQAAIRMSQGYARSPAPYIMGQVQGTLGQMMNAATNPAGTMGSLSDPFRMNLSVPQPPSLPQGANPWTSLMQPGAPYQTTLGRGSYPYQF